MIKSSDQILIEAVKELTATIEIHQINLSIKKFDFAASPKIKADKKIKNIPYDHFLYKSKAYRDKTSACFKTIKAFAERIENAKELFIRMKPKIISDKNFDKNYVLYRGFFRVSMPEIKRTGYKNVSYNYYR